MTTMPDKDGGLISMFEEAKDQARGQVVENVENMWANVIDMPAGGQKVTRQDRQLRFQQYANDPMEAEVLFDREAAAHGLNPFNPEAPQDWQVPRSVIAYLRARRREQKAMED